MKESYKDSNSNDLASSALTSHENGDSQPRANNPLVKQEIPEDDDEPPIRPSYKDQHQSAEQQQEQANEKLQEGGDNDDAPNRIATHDSHVKSQHDAGNLILEKRPFDRDPTELAKYLHTSLSSGLDESEAQSRLKQYGKNILKGQGKVTVWTVLWRQVSNAMTVILLGALAIAFATQDYAEGSVIAGTFPQTRINHFSYCCSQCWYRFFSGVSR